MKLKLIIYPYAGLDLEGYNSRQAQGKYFCDPCIYFSDGTYCMVGKGDITNRYVCATFKKYKLKKL